MTFEEIVPALRAGSAVRRDEWSPRRSIQIIAEPWNGERRALLFVDTTGKAGPYPYCLKGDDLDALDWSIIS